MPEDKQISWNKKPVMLRSVWSAEIKGLLLKHSPGAFYFNDGTTQGWTIDQLYDVDSLAQLIPAAVPGQAPGFVLANSQHRALAASTALLVITDFGVKWCQFFLDSPNLSGNSFWQQSKGVQVDLFRTFTSPMGEPKPLADMFTAQLQAVYRDPKTSVLTTYGEWDQAAQKHLFHVIKLMQPYQIQWKFPQLAGYQLLQVRVRFTMPSYTGKGLGEVLPKGSWLLGNVIPL